MPIFLIHESRPPQVLIYWGEQGGMGGMGGVGEQKL